MGVTLSAGELVDLRALWRRQGKTVAFTNGCFDLLHPGHVRLLEAARAQADALVVAVNSDASVRRLKGERRPILPAHERAKLLASLAAVDAVAIFEEDTPCELLKQLQPDILVKGSDWSHWIAGQEIVEAAGGAVRALPVEPGYSTTELVNQILERSD